LLRRVEVDEDAPLERTLRVVLERDADLPILVEGTVRLPTGRGLPDARVGFGYELKADCDDEGGFSFEVPADEWDSATDLWAAHGGLVPMRLSATERTETELHLSADGEHRVFRRDLVLSQTRIDLKVRVVEADGTAAAPGLAVYPWQREALGWEIWEDVERTEDGAVPTVQVRTSASTDDEGRCELTGLFPDTYLLRVLDRETGFTWTSEPIDAAAIARAGTEAVLRLPRDRLRDEIEVRVVDRAGRPVAGVEATVRYVTWHSLDGGTSASRTDQRAETDESGRVVLRRVPRENLGISLGHDSIVSRDFEIPADHPDGAAFEVRVDRMCHVRIDATAHPDAVHVSLLDRDGARLYLTRRFGSGSMSTDSLALTDGKTGVVSTSDRATTAVLVGKKGEITRVPIQLSPDLEVNEIRL
jgi:protocatechuate 3,4-dioxygenase beta subunit